MAMDWVSKRAAELSGITDSHDKTSSSAEGPPSTHTRHVSYDFRRAVPAAFVPPKNMDVRRNKRRAEDHAGLELLLEYV